MNGVADVEEKGHSNCCESGILMHTIHDIEGFAQAIRFPQVLSARRLGDPIRRKAFHKITKNSLLCLPFSSLTVSAFVSKMKLLSGMILIYN